VVYLLAPELVVDVPSCGYVSQPEIGALVDAPGPDEIQKESHFAKPS
jgi:hypothetical protein